MTHRNSLQGYKMSFSTGGLFHNESIEIARLHEPQDSWEETLLQAMEEGTTSLPKAASNRRTTREIINRISCLTEEERDYLVGQANRQEQAALLWLATCRAYRLIREFAVEVIRERHMSYSNPPFLTGLIRRTYTSGLLC